MRAAKLKQVDETNRDMYSIWSSLRVKEIDKEGNTVYPKFKDFFDYDKALKKVTDPNNDIKHKEFDDLRKMAIKLQKFRGEEVNK